MDLLHLPGVVSFFQHLLPDLFRPAPAAHHADIGGRPLQDPAQAFHVVAVFAGHNHKGRHGIIAGLIQCLPERFADHPMSSGLPGFFGKFTPVLDHGDLIAEHHADADHAQGYMPGAADHQPFPV